MSGIQQNAWPVRWVAKPSPAQQKVHARAEAAYHARWRAQLDAGHDLAEFLLKLSLEPSGRRSELLHIAKSDF